MEINSQAAEGQETVPRDLEGGDSHDVGTMNSLPPLDLGPQPGENLREYMLRPTLKGHVVQCCIHRNQQGLEKGLFPVYYLYLEAAEGWKVRSRSQSFTSSSKSQDFQELGRSSMCPLQSQALPSAFLVVS